MSWTTLVERFQKLKDKTGCDKMTSYEVKIWVDLYEGWSVELGTYDIADWPRHTNVGTFKTEQEAMEAFENKIIEAEKAVDSWLEESSYGEKTCGECFDGYIGGVYDPCSDTIKGGKKCLKCDGEGVIKSNKGD